MIASEFVLAALRAHAEAEYPRESCGLIVMIDGEAKYVPCRTQSRSGSHSRAITSNAPASRELCAARAAFFCSAGSIPRASTRLASSLRLRALANETSGNTPNASSFSLPPYRYFQRQYRDPAGLISRYRPPASESLIGFAPGFVFRTATSVRGIWGYHDGGSGYVPQVIPPRSHVLCRTELD